MLNVMVLGTKDYVKAYGSFCRLQNDPYVFYSLCLQPALILMSSSLMAVKAQACFAVIFCKDMVPTRKTCNKT